MSDRIAGALICAVAILYVVVAGNYAVSFADPVGASVFPRLVGIPAILLAASLVLRPGPEARWASGRGLLRQAGVLALLLAYALFLEQIGFVPATLVLVAVMSMVMGARPLAAGMTGLITVPALYLLFDRVLGLPLEPLGSYFG